MSSVKSGKRDYNFKFRVSGIIIQNDKLLLVNMDDSNFWCLPGGYVEMGENTIEAVKREFKEETLRDVTIKKYLGVMESFFVNKYSKTVHEIAFYYLLDFVDEVEECDFDLIENDNGHNVKLKFKWIDVNKIYEYDIRPDALKGIISSGKLEFNHLIIDKF